MDNARPFMDGEELYPQLGLCRNTFYKLARQGKLPVRTIFLGERRMVFSRKEVEALIQGKPVN